MGKHRDLQTRLDEARVLATKNAKSADRHYDRLKRAELAGNRDKLKEATRLWHRACDLRDRWTKESRRLAASLRIAATLQSRAPTPHVDRAASQPTDKQLKEVEQTRKRMAKAGITHWDPRTATGRREIDVTTLGPQMRASINHMNSCFRKREDRTVTRVLAWSRVDEHFHRVHAGDIATPRYEPGVDAERRPGVADSRLEALRQDAGLRADLGAVLHAVLHHVVYHHRTFREVAAIAGMDERSTGTVFKMALDHAAIHFGLDATKKKGLDMVEALHRVKGTAPLAHE